MIQIEGRTGEKLDVTKHGEILVRSERWRAAIERGDAYVFNSLDKDIDTTDTLLAVRNDSLTRNLIVEKIVYQSGNAACIYETHIVTVVYTSAGAAVTGFNINTASNKVADATSHSDETGNAQGTIIAEPSLVATATFALDNLGVVLATGVAIAVDQVGESTAGSVQVFAYFEDRD